MRRPIIIALLAAAAAAGAWNRVRHVVVAGTSMLPTLAPGDRLVLLRVVGRPRVGQLVVAHDPRVARRLLLKRVHAVAGDRVDLQGDNSAASTDSRTFGPVPVGAVERCVGWRYAPAHRMGYVGGMGPLSGWRARRDRRRSRRSDRR